ncbi:hypothetical protein [Streptomyces cyaneofuscatus]|uniref:hypothetical protein n=1 Tax=Streptomyces cyaneofuscatus TaxID=66883 RepID=UPI003420AE44
MVDRSCAARTVAITGDGSLWTQSAAWTVALRELIQTYLGPDRRGHPLSHTAPGRSYEDDIAACPKR